MRVISLKPLREFWERHPHAEQPLRQWYKTATFAELPAQFEQLVRMMPPQAVQDEVQYANTLEVIDRLMGVAKLTKGQALYLETLVQLSGTPPRKTSRSKRCWLTNAAISCWHAIRESPDEWRGRCPRQAKKYSHRS